MNNGYVQEVQLNVQKSKHIYIKNENISNNSKKKEDKSSAHKLGHRDY